MPPTDPRPALRLPTYSGCELAGLVLLSALVGATGALGASYGLGQGSPALDGAATLVVAVAGGALFAIAACLTDGAYGRLLRPARPLRSRAGGGRRGGRPLRQRLGRMAAWLVPEWDRRRLGRCVALMALCWLPWLVANFPGGAYWDTYYQIWQTFPGSHPISIIPFGEHGPDTVTDAYFCDHHPLLDTLIYGAFAQVSQALTGAWQAGSLAFVTLQGGLTALALTAACARLRRWGAPRGAVLAAYGFFCLAPFVSTWALTMVKDSLFSLAYVPYFLLLGEVVRTRGAVLRPGRRRALAWLVGLGVLLCLTKKTGLFVVVPTALVAALAYRQCWRAFALQAASCAAVMALVLPLVVFPLMSVAPGGKQEALGPLLQQTAAYVAAHSGETTEQERAVIDAVVPYDELASLYEWSCHDNVKYEFRLDASLGDIASYVGVWAAQGLRHPETYFAAFMGVASGYVAPVQTLNIRSTTCETTIDNVLVLYNPDALDPLREGMAGAYAAWEGTPVACLPLEACLYVWWLPLLLAFVAWRRRLRCGLLFVPGAVVLAFCLIGPIFDARYCLPLLYTVPLLALMVAALLRPAVPGPGPAAGREALAAASRSSGPRWLAGEPWPASSAPGRGGGASWPAAPVGHGGVRDGAPSGSDGEEPAAPAGRPLRLEWSQVRAKRPLD